jgi:hypothetical protein
VRTTGRTAIRRRRGARAGWRASLIVASALLPLAVAAAAGIQAASIVWTPALVIFGCAASVLAYTTLRPHVEAGGPRRLCSWGEVERGLARELRRARRRRVLRGRSACLPGEMPPSSPFPTSNSRRQ